MFIIFNLLDQITSHLVSHGKMYRKNLMPKLYIRVERFRVWYMFSMKRLSIIFLVSTEKKHSYLSNDYLRFFFDNLVIKMRGCSLFFLADCTHWFWSCKSLMWSYEHQSHLSKNRYFLSSKSFANTFKTFNIPSFEI